MSGRGLRCLRGGARVVLVVLVLAVLVLGAGFGQGTLPAALAAAVLAGQACGHAALVSAGLLRVTPLGYASTAT